MPKSSSPPPGARSHELEARGSAAWEGAWPDDGPTTGGPRRLSQRMRATLQVTRGPLLAAGLIMASVAAFILAASFFLLPPGLDVAVADIFYISGHGHFLSDVAFAGILMCVPVAGLHLLIIDAQPLWRRAALALADR